MKLNYSEPKPLFSVPFLGNGEIAFLLSADGSMNRISGFNEYVRNSSASNVIFWQGRRYVGSSIKPLIPFGRFVDALGETPICAEQELDPKIAEVTCRTEYSGGAVHTRAFVDTDRNLIVIKKELNPTTELNYSFTYAFCGKEDMTEKPMLIQMETRKAEYGGEIAFSMTDRLNRNGTIRVACDTEMEPSLGENSVTFSLKATEKRELTFYILLCDNFEREYSSEDVDRDIRQAVNEGYDAIKERHSKVWVDYHNEGYVTVGDEKIDRTYLMSQYNMKCFTTKWSLPVAIHDHAWEGRFFGFDEHYIMLGLLTSNHHEAAKRVPVFRKNGLAHAIERGSSRHHRAAHYPWETVEDGTDATPIGYWNDHIFNMATIPLSGWEYYLHTNDKEFLRDTVYPVLEACAEFYKVRSIYRVDGGKLIVGRCTDFERLGSDVINPYVTTCGVIAEMRAFAKASDILGINPELAAEYRQISDELLDALPHDEGKYLPYPGCTDRNIGVFGGTYPFDVIRRDDPMQLEAIKDYLDYEDIFGNMYAYGKGVCSWYSAWKSIVYTRLGMPVDATAAIRYIADRTGDFGEVYEIYDTVGKHFVKPWFTTAAGIYTQAVNEVLVSYTEDGEPMLLAGLDDSLDTIRFKLSLKGGMTVVLSAKNNEIEELSVYGNQFCETDCITVHLPARFGGDRIVQVIR